MMVSGESRQQQVIWEVVLDENGDVSELLLKKSITLGQGYEDVSIAISGFGGF